MINNISFTSITRLLVGVGLVLFIGCGSTKRPVSGGVKSVADKEIKKNATTNNVTEKEEIEHSTQPKGRSSLDSIYPKEYKDAWGKEGYHKIRKGVFINGQEKAIEAEIRSLRDSQYYSIQKDTSMSHRFGKIVLKKNRKGWYTTRYNDGFTYSEFYPNIVNKQTTQTSFRDRVVLFYGDKKNNVKKINVKKLNPYLKEYDNLIFTYPDFERYEAPPKNEILTNENAKPDSYLTFYDGGVTAMNGFTSVVFSLVPVRNNKILAWESKMVVLGKQGNILAIYREDNQVTGPQLSNDRRLLVYRYGQFLDNPYDQSPKGEYRVLDLESGEIVLKLIPKDGYKVTRSRAQFGYIEFGYTDLKQEHETIIVDIVDLNSRKRYYREFSKKELLIARERYHYESYLELLIFYSFTKTDF